MTHCSIFSRTEIPTRRQYTGISVPLTCPCFFSPQSSAFEVPDSTKPEIRAALIEGNIKMTVNLDDPRWKTGAARHARLRAPPGENTPPPQKTIARVLYNTDYVYFRFRVQGHGPAAIRAHISDRDKIFDDDFVGIILDNTATTSARTSSS